MFLLAGLTIIRYRQISEFRSKSIEFSFVVSGDESDISAARSDLTNMTFQSVEQEDIGGGKYRLWVRCPPDSVGSVSSFLHGKKILKEEP